MVRHMYDMMRLKHMKTCFSIRGEYVTHMNSGEFQGFQVILAI